MQIPDSGDLMNDTAERIVPRSLAPGRPVANERTFQPIWIIVKIGERRGFSTDVATAQEVVGVSADRDDTVPLHLDGDAARRFAQRARCEMLGVWGHSRILQFTLPET
jgi:hypothetical protein